MITIEDLREVALSLPYVSEEMPFGPDYIVYKVGGKMFMLLALDTPYPSINVKCDPDRAIELRMRYSAVRPGYHMNKRHWNTIRGDMDMDKRGIVHEIHLSYQLVFEKLPKKTKTSLQEPSTTA